MTEICRRMQNDDDDDDDSPAKCRERRRRRIEMRRLTSISGGHTQMEPVGKDNRMESSTHVTDAKRIKTVDAGDGVEASTVVEPAYGTMSVSGRLREMEDAIAVRKSLCRPEITSRRPVHFFGVFDGHGGSHVSALCREWMHVFVEDELMRVHCTEINASEGGGGHRSNGRRAGGDEEVDEQRRELWVRAMKRSFQRMDEMALNTCACGSVGHQCGCHSMEVALAGSTAVVAILTPEHIVVANCGDSRAVLFRGRRAIPLSNDHKPDRADELARIEAAGGRVIFVNGARVEGILAMSRAIGDKYLKRVVTSEPEISYMRREPEDECLILASDGLWDVVSSETACQVAHECLREGRFSAAANAGSHVEGEGETLFPSPSVFAAALLTRLALGRKSSDNISVIVVDLKRS